MSDFKGAALPAEPGAEAGTLLNRLRTAGAWLLDDLLQQRNTWAGLAVPVGVFAPRYAGASEGIVTLGLASAGVAAIIIQGKKP